MSRPVLLARFRDGVAARPTAPAVSDAVRALDHAALARASARVAEAIRAAGGEEPGGRVVLLCGHRVEAIAALLGALEADRAIVPLPVHEDDAVLASLARDADARVWVVDASQAARARALADAIGGAAAPAIALDDELVVFGSVGSRAEPERSTPDRPDPLVDADALLAILYTSGTTARPKGVMTTAASALERARQYREASGLTAGGRQAAITAWHFAASLPEVWGALLAGAELCLYDARERGVDGLPEWLRERGIGWLQLPVSMARRMLVGLGPGALAGVRFVSISGDRLRRREAVALLEAMAPDGVLLHTYGSSETNLIAQSALRLPDVDCPVESEAGFLPVGRPVAGKRVHVLDEHGEAVARGAIGRIAVESPLLSPGYWRQPERTAERFRRAQAGGRLFLTDDFGRLRLDGCLELTGRDTTQVKVRGMRVDLAAVEAQLLALDGVAGAAVALRTRSAGGAARDGEDDRRGGDRDRRDVRGDRDDDERLVAWIEPVAGVDLDTTGVRRALQRRLPAHWLPARFVFVDALPWTPSGKLDRRRLPDPGSERPRLGVAFAPPRDERETWVCAKWAELFALESVGRDDDFFDLGGDSLLLLEMLTGIERETGRPISLGALEGLPTPARIAALLRRESERAGAGGAVGADGDAAGREGEGRSEPEGGIGIAGEGAALRYLGVRAAPRAKASLPRRLQRGLKQSLRHPLRGAGPIVFGRPLAYERGFGLHRRVARVLAPLPLFRGRLRAIDAWHARLGLDADPARARLRSFMANTWGEWRLRALEDAEAFARTVAIEGGEQLDALADSGRGIVLVVTHVYWNALLRRLPALRKRPFALVRQPKGGRFGGGEDAVATARAEQLQTAVRVLAQGGVALIAGDAGRGREAVEIAFHGVPRRFRLGAATLAESTGALLVPVFSRLEDDGRIAFRFEAPLVSEAETPPVRIRDRTERYAALYAEHWPRIFDSLGWKNVRRALDPPEGW
ncbi:MAG: AMP-binding protein [Myxococcota bacterium]